LADRFNVISGLSDHTMGTTAPIVATAFGAKIIEKHICSIKNMYITMQ
jgi:pseudaminic acid synthase